MIDSLKDHISDNKKLYKNGALVVGGYLLARLAVKRFALTPVEYKSKTGDKDLDINIDLSQKDRERIKNYFDKIGLFLDGYFLKKYLSYFKGINPENRDKLKNTYHIEDLDKIIFPVSYYKIQENSSLVNFLREICSDLGIETQEFEYKKLVHEIKNYYKINSHMKILNELKKYISESDNENWQKLYYSKPVSILS